MNSPAKRELPEFTAANETLAGMEWVRKFTVACRPHGFGQEHQEAIVAHATEGRTRLARGVLCDEVLAVRATWKRVLAGLSDPPADGSLVFDVTKKKTKTVPAVYKLRGIVISHAVHVAAVEQVFPGTEVA